MATYTYRQPVAGQALVDLIEGQHPKMTLDRFVGKYVAVCCFVPAGLVREARRSMPCGGTTAISTM